VLQVCGKDNRFVSGFSGKLNSEVPGVEGDEGEFTVLGNLLSDKFVKPCNGVSEGSGVSDVLPSEGG
jgi:hypothetical protein